MNKINFLIGDATSPQTKGQKIICHVCNDIGKWGKGFVLAISKKWLQPETEYKKWYQERKTNDFALGTVQFVQVEEEIAIANMIGQKGIKSVNNNAPIRYDAIENCLMQVSNKAIQMKASIHMPRIGCGLAGGKWSMIETIIRKTLIDKGIGTYVYDFEK